MSLLNTLKFITNHPLNRSHKLKALARFAQWQIGSRLVPGAVVFDWINGSRFLVRTGERGITGNIYTGLHEFSDMAFLLHFLRPEDLFVDVGANVGSYTILASAVVGARSYAFEPVPRTYGRLVENMRLNHLDDRVLCINKGVGAEQGSLVFTSDRDTTNHAVASGEEAANTIMVDVTSLDGALRDESPTLLKIDVEGFETRVLEGSRAVLRKPTLQSVIMELNGSGARYGFDESRIVRGMHDFGFKGYGYDPFSRSLVDLSGQSRAGGNTLFLRDGAFVMDRLRQAAKVSVHGVAF